MACSCKTSSPKWQLTLASGKVKTFYSKTAAELAHAANPGSTLAPV